MNAAYTRSRSTYRTSRRSLLAMAGGAAAIAVAGSRLNLTLAQDTSFGAPAAVGSGSAHFAGGTYAVSGDGWIHQYAVTDDGYASYNAYDGSSWSGWQYEDEYPVLWDPAPVAWNGGSHAYYTGDDGAIYRVGWDGESASWEDVSGDYEFAAAPYATAWQDSISLYGASTDGYVYHKQYADGDWSDWAAISDSEYPVKTDAKPYSVNWKDTDHTFWLDDDGYTHWARYDYAEQAWTEPRLIDSDYAFQSTPYAVGYDADDALYVYGVNADGGAVYNVFKDDAWAGWEPIDAGWASTYQPSVYVKGDVQHVVYVDNDNHARYTTYSADGWADGWEDLGDNYAYDTSQYEYGDDLYLTYAGDTGDIYYRIYSGEEEDDTGY